MFSRFICCSLASILLFSLHSCVDPQEVHYLQDVQINHAERINKEYKTVIQKDDQLYVAVSSKEPQLTAPFLMAEMGTSPSTNTNSTNRPKGYLVDSQGYVVLPVIGKMKASGLTCSEFAKDVEDKLRSTDYIKDASVNVQIVNFKISVIGEVTKPGIYDVSGQRITIIEAISKAGDLTIDGNREVLVIREQNGERKTAKVDLRNKDLFKSPYYYLQQNDTIYVEPSERKVNMRSETLQLWTYSLSGISIIVAIIALAV